MNPDWADVFPIKNGDFPAIGLRSMSDVLALALECFFCQQNLYSGNFWTQSVLAVGKRLNFPWSFVVFVCPLWKIQRWNLWKWMLRQYHDQMYKFRFEFGVSFGESWPFLMNQGVLCQVQHYVWQVWGGESRHFHYCSWIYGPSIAFDTTWVDLLLLVIVCVLSWEIDICKRCSCFMFLRPSSSRIWVLCFLFPAP